MRHETSTVEQRRRERSYGLRIRSTPPMCVLAEATVLPRLASCASLWCALSRCFMIMLPSTLLRPSKSLETAFPMGTARAPFVVDERLTHGDHPLGDGRGLDHALKMSSDVHVTRADQARRLLGERPAGQVHRVPGRARRRHRVSTHAATRARAGGHLVGPVLAVDCKLLAHAGDGGDRLLSLGLRIGLRSGLRSVLCSSLRLGQLLDDVGQRGCDARNGAVQAVARRCREHQIQRLLVSIRFRIECAHSFCVENVTHNVARHLWDHPRNL
mmetsp:Transcript_12411/g.33189  ORF Transcript_12411/g.33189 Transcript_12411/m.33189 type:complete len:271 (+) Transcript_12411:245-1057(+)